jgi:hypothetical protein
MTRQSAAKQGADSRYPGKALLWSLASGPLTLVPIIVGSVGHTSAVNRRIEAHFESLSFTGKLTKAQSDCDGLFLFQAARWDQKTGKPYA